MAGNDLQGGTVDYGTSLGVPATIGSFAFTPDLVSGGFSPHMSATLEIDTADLPTGTTFQKADRITVNPTVGSPRPCIVDAFTIAGVLWQLIVKDVDQNA